MLQSTLKKLAEEICQSLPITRETCNEVTQEITLDGYNFFIEGNIYFRFHVSQGDYFTPGMTEDEYSSHDLTIFYKNIDDWDYDLCLTQSDLDVLDSHFQKIM